MIKFCTVLDEDIYMNAREAYEYRFGRWKKGSLKGLLEMGLKMFLERYPLPKRRK